MHSPSCSLRSRAGPGAAAAPAQLQCEAALSRVGCTLPARDTCSASESRSHEGCKLPTQGHTCTQPTLRLCRCRAQPSQVTVEIRLCQHCERSCARAARARDTARIPGYKYQLPGACCWRWRTMLRTCSRRACIRCGAQGLAAARSGECAAHTDLHSGQRVGHSLGALLQLGQPAALRGQLWRWIQGSHSQDVCAGRLV